MRSEFEKLPWIAELLKYKDKCYFDDATESYIAYYNYETGFLNGAWYAYQEQQKKIDELVKEKRDHIDRMNNIFNGSF